MRNRPGKVSSRPHWVMMESPRMFQAALQGRSRTASRQPGGIRSFVVDTVPLPAQHAFAGGLCGGVRAQTSAKQQQNLSKLQRRTSQSRQQALSAASVKRHLKSPQNQACHTTVSCAQPLSRRNAGIYVRLQVFGGLSTSDGLSFCCLFAGADLLRSLRCFSKVCL